MPTKRYGLSVRLATQQRYGIQSSAGPVLSGQKRYGLTTENRQIVSTSYPLQTQPYSIRYGREWDVSARAKRREREFFASLVAPDASLIDERIFDASQVDVQQAESISIHEIELTAAEQAERIHVFDSTMEGTDEFSLIARISEAQEETIASALHVTPYSASLLESEPFRVERFADVSEAFIEASTIRSPVMLGVMDGDVLSGTIQNQITEADLYELESMSSPYKMALEQALDPMVLRVRTYDTNELAQQLLKRSTDPLETVESAPDVASGEQKHHETEEMTLQSALNFAPASSVELTEIQDATYQQRIFEARQLNELSELSPVRQMDAEELVTDSLRPSGNVSEVTIETSQEADVIKNVFSTELTEIDATEQRRLYQATVHEQDLALHVDEMTPIDLVPLIESTRTEDMIEIEISALLEFDKRPEQKQSELVILEQAQKERPFIADLSELMDAVSFDAPNLVELLEQMESERITPIAEAYLENLEGAGAIQFPVEELTLDPAVRVMALKDILLSETDAVSNPHMPTEAIEMKSDRADRIQQSIVEMEQTTQSFIERIRAVTMETTVLMERENASLAEWHSPEELTRFKQSDAILDEGDEIQSAASEAVLEETDEATRTDDEAILFDPTEATRNAVEEVRNVVQDYAERTMSYAEMVDHLEASRTIKEIVLTDQERAERKAIAEAVLEEIGDADKYVKKKKRIWLIPARGNHWNNWSNWKKTR